MQSSRPHGPDALSSSSGSDPAFEWGGVAGLSVGKREARRKWEAMRGPSLVKYTASAVAAGIAGVVSDPNRVLPELLEPGDAINKIFKPNCTRCRGCTAQLYDMQSAEAVEDWGAGTGSGPGGGSLPPFQHSIGTTPTWQFFARVPMSAKRFVIKVRTACIWIAARVQTYVPSFLLGLNCIIVAEASFSAHGCVGAMLTAAPIGALVRTVALGQQLHRVLPAGAPRRSAR